MQINPAAISKYPNEKTEIKLKRSLILEKEKDAIAEKAVLVAIATPAMEFLSTPIAFR